MGKNLFQTQMLLTILVLSVILSCIQRESDPDTRTNPYDPGSRKWTESAAPVVTVASDSIWYDFNHSTSTGTIRIGVQEDDLNFPYDTVVGSIFYNGMEIKLPRMSSKKDTSFLLSGIKPFIPAQCTAIVYDSKQKVTTKPFDITVPDSLPAVPPQARVINSSQQVTLTWTQTPNTKYVVFYSDSLNGPYSGCISVNQANSSTATVYNEPSGYFPRYYIVAATNKFGTARSADTIIGRRYYSGISTPSLSASQGSYPSYIKLSIYNSTSNLDYIEIYRSTTDTSSFRLIKKVMTSGSGYLYYNDSVQTPSNYYYKVYAIDKQGRCSFPSTKQMGYLQRLNAPTLYINPSPDIINLRWTSVSGGTTYRVYKSPLNCSDSLKLLAETNLTSITDTPPDRKIYYFSVSAISNKGYEGSRSGCVQGRVMSLPQPDSVVVCWYNVPRHTIISWKKVESSSGYVIYRSGPDLNNKIVMDTVTGTVYTDTLLIDSVRYYQVVAFNNIGLGSIESYHGGPIQIPSFTTYTSGSDSLLLTMAQNNNVLKYYLYSSADTSAFKLVDSLENSLYTASLKDYKPVYFRYEIRTKDGVSFPSGKIAVVRQLSVPSNIKVTEDNIGVRFRWNKVNGADSYVVMKSSNGTSNWVEYFISDTVFFDTLSSSLKNYYHIYAKNEFTRSFSTDPIHVGRLSPPSSPVSLTIDSKLSYLILSWSMPSTGPYPRGFIILRSTDNVNFTQIDSTKDNQYFDSVPDTIKYYYRISAYNEAGVSPPSQSYGATLINPLIPQNLDATLGTSKTHIQISWSNVNGISKYSIYRSLFPDGTYDYLRSVENANVYYDSSCSENTPYYYKVASITIDDQKVFSDYVTGIRLGPPTIKEIYKNDDRIIISWNRFPFAVQSFLIYRTEYPDSPYVKIDSISSNGYSDAHGKINYYYKISAFNGVESDLSEAISQSYTNLNVPVKASEGTQTNSINISWATISEVIGYRVYRSPIDSFNQYSTRIAEVTSTTYTDNVNSDSIYYYKITAKKPIGETGFSSGTGRGFRLPTSNPYPPQKPSITTENGNIIINWNPAPTSVGYSEYKVYKSNTFNSSYEWIASINASSGLKTLKWTDKTAIKSPGKLWYYITTANIHGESVPSDTISAEY